MTMIANSPYQTEEILLYIKNYLDNNLRDIKSITIRSRCINCFKKVNDYTIKFNKKHIHIKQWCLNCNTSQIYQNEMNIKNFNFDNFHIYIDKLNKDIGFALIMKYYASLNIEIPISSYYSSEDYKIHGEMAYKDRKIKMIQREINNGIIIMLQNFIDFKGLEPKFSETIIIKFK